MDSVEAAFQAEMLLVTLTHYLVETAKMKILLHVELVVKDEEKGLTQSDLVLENPHVTVAYTECLIHLPWLLKHPSVALLFQIPAEVNLNAHPLDVVQNHISSKMTANSVEPHK